MGNEDIEEFTEAELENEIVRELRKQLVPEPGFKDTLDTVLVVDNLPKVGQEKIPKLKTVIEKIYSGCGKIVKDGLYLPVDDKGNTLGYLIDYFYFIKPPVVYNKNNIDSHSLNLVLPKKLG